MVKIFLHEGGIMPKKETEGAIAYDVKLPNDVYIKPGRQIIPLQFSVETPIGVEAKIEPRSGFSAKGMEGADKNRYNADVIPGKADSDYRGIVGVIVNSMENHPFLMAKGTRIAQMTFYRESGDELVQVASYDDLSKTERGEGGFGHTGVK